MLSQEGYWEQLQLTDYLQDRASEEETYMVIAQANMAALLIIEAPAAFTPTSFRQGLSF